MKTLIRLASLSIVLLVAFLGYRSVDFYRRPATVGSQPVVIEIQNGESLTTVLGNLNAAGVRIDPFFRRLWIRNHHAERKLQIGEFSLQPEWSAAQVLQHLFFGTPMARSVTIKEGSNLYEIESLLRSKGIKGAEGEFSKIVRKPEYLARMGVPANLPEKAKSLEGFLFPETYTYFKSDTVQKVVEAMLSQFEEKALPLLKKVPMGQTPEGRFQLLTLASVVEKESGNLAEQPVVASVFWNRLKKKMRLESDPTIIYGLLPNFDGNIRRGDIRAPSVWNTYVIRTLPAGPIANPGLTAIQAVVEPAVTDYLYFVAKGAGEHVFARTYEEHAKNVERYQLRRSAKN
jgi:UPF0755 protein